MELIFTEETIGQEVEKIKKEINAPFVNARVGALGNSTIMIVVSLDEKSKWINNILENSRYFRISIDNNGVMENFLPLNRYNKMRKTQVKSVDEAIQKINKFINTVKPIHASKVSKELNIMAKHIYSSEVYMVSDLSNYTAYFVKSKNDARDRTDKSAIEEAEKSGETITMGKTVVTPQSFWARGDKENYKEYGLGKLFKF